MALTPYQICMQVNKMNKNFFFENKKNLLENTFSDQNFAVTSFSHFIDQRPEDGRIQPDQPITPQIDFCSFQLTYCYTIDFIK